MVHILSLSYVGSKPQPGHYNPDSVAERDFLRTEGDPAAIGYTINEAVSLTRSVVCSTLVRLIGTSYFVFLLENQPTAFMYASTTNLLC